MAGPESKFQHSITNILDRWIKQGKPLYYFVKQAGSIRGIPDLIICANGRFIAWEVKPTAEEAAKTGGRIALQKYNISRIVNAGGEADVIHPGNIVEALHELEGLLARAV